MELYSKVDKYIDQYGITYQVRLSVVKILCGEGESDS